MTCRLGCGVGIIWEKAGRVNWAILVVARGDMRNLKRNSFVFINVVILLLSHLKTV